MYKYKSKFLSLFLSLLLSGTVSAQEYSTYSVPDRPVIGAVQNDGYRIDNQAFQADSVEAFRKSYVDAVTLLLGGAGK